MKNTFIGDWYYRKAKDKTPEIVTAISKDKSDFAKTKRYNVKANLNQLNAVMRTKPELVNLVVPYGDKDYILNLAKVEVITENLEVETNEGKVKHNTGVQYRGIVDGNPEHIASMSLTTSDRSIYFSTEEGNFVITKDGVGFIAYNDVEMEVPGVLYCETPEEEITSPLTGEPCEDPNPTTSELISGVGCKVVDIYFECDYAFYVSKGSNVTTVTNYVIGMFNQVAAIYANENIAVNISSIYVWTTPDPYASMSSSATLSAFRSNRGTSFNGHLAHFLSTRSPLGGIAYVNTLCNKSYAYAVSRISSSYSNFPTYSWTVNVVAHELGHNLGSNHTHNCGWSGGAIDNCYTPEGSCVPGPSPIGGGTIMSYCHLTNYGVNFNKGFGPQPGNLIRSRVQNASCITSTVSADAPTGLSATNITSTSASLSWTSAPSTYTVQYKTSTSSTWLTAGTTSSTTYNLTGLTPGVLYNWKVKSDCSPYSATSDLTTLSSGGSTVCLAPTSLNVSSLSTSSATLNWNPSTDATSYTVQYKTNSATTWLNLSTNTTSINITGLTPGTLYVWKVKANCSSFSSQSSFTTNSTITPPTGCPTPTNPFESNLGSTSVTLNWTPPSDDVNSYVLYKVYGSLGWLIKTVTVDTNFVNLTNLSRGKQYQWKVRSKCANGYTSSYTPIRTFTTKL